MVYLLHSHPVKMYHSLVHNLLWSVVDHQKKEKVSHLCGGRAPHNHNFGSRYSWVVSFTLQILYMSVIILVISWIGECVYRPQHWAGVMDFFWILIKFISFNYAVKYPQKTSSIFFCISNHVIIWNKLKLVIFVKADGLYEINGNCKS